MIDKAFWHKKKVLITGHTGFKGSWLAVWLLELGAEVAGFSLDPKRPEDNFNLCRLDQRMDDVRGDICVMGELQEAFEKYAPEVVFHLAAQSIVRGGYERPVDTYAVNVMGTLNVLECVRNTKSVQAAVIITTDKCYENKENTRPYKETDPLGGYDPYSSSKACAEILTASYRSSFMNPNSYEKHAKAISTARAGNVIGGGDWAKDRIVPDCIRAIENGVPILLRNPGAVRPWQHVLEALGGYLTLAERLVKYPTEYCEGWNFGPDQKGASTVRKLADIMVRVYGCGDVVEEKGVEHPHEAGMLYLDTSKAKERLGWRTIFGLEKTLEMTAEWYKRYKSEDVYALCAEQIKEYMEVI